MSAPRSSAIALGSAALVGCASVALAPPQVTVQRSGSDRAPVTHVIALAPTCGTLSLYASFEEAGSVCAPAHLASVSQRIRGELELHGTVVTDAERVSAEVRARSERIDESESQARASATRDEGEDARAADWRSTRTRTSAVVVRGARFEDVPPALQAELVSDLRADAVLVTRLFVGPMAGMGARRTARAQLRLQRVGTGEVLWTSRCDVEVALERSDAASLEQASLCALRRALSP